MRRQTRSAVVTSLAIQFVNDSGKSKLTSHRRVVRGGWLLPANASVVLALGLLIGCEKPHITPDRPVSPSSRRAAVPRDHSFDVASGFAATDLAHGRGTTR